MDRNLRLKRLHFRAWHRGTREADLLVGGFFDRHGEAWNEQDMLLFEHLLEEQDVDIMAWALGAQPPPDRYQGSMMRALQTLDYIEHPR
jgi:antitoxin CptB